MNTFRIWNSTKFSITINLALFVLIIAGVTIYCEPTIIGLNKELISSAPETKSITDAPPKVSVPLPEPVRPGKAHKCKAILAEAAELIDVLRWKNKEIDELIQYYQSGINDLEEQIIQESQDKKIIHYTRAVKNKQVELNLRTIQRRRLYIEKLEKSNIWIRSGSEELLYLKRKTQYVLHLIDIAGGIDLRQHMKHLSAAIQRNQPSFKNLPVNLKDANILPLEVIWSRIVIPKEKIAQARVGTANQEKLKSTLPGELNYADLSTFHKIISTRLPRYSRLIKTAAKKHGFDWRLIAAQIYQESHLNPLAKSSVGARGLMQILPRTARSLGVKDIYNAAENVNAGVQYLKTLCDHYEGIEGIDRTMMALAAYNAGRGHIEDARRLAINKNLNPDSWESLARTLPLLEYRKYYEKSKYGYCRGTEPVIYAKRIMSYYTILKRKGTEYKTAQAKLQTSDPESEILNP